MRGGRDCRFKELGQAQTLKTKNMLSLCEFMKEVRSFWKVILPKMRFRPAHTLKMKRLLPFLRIYEGHGFMLVWLGQACGEGEIADLRSSAKRKH